MTDAVPSFTLVKPSGSNSTAPGPRYTIHATDRPFGGVIRRRFAANWGRLTGASGEPFRMGGVSCPTVLRREKSRT